MDWIVVGNYRENIISFELKILINKIKLLKRRD